MDLKDKLKELRKNNKKNQNEIALILNQSLTTYASYEQGKSKPNYEQLITLANFYNISLDELCGRTTINNIKLSQIEIDLLTELRSLDKNALLKVVGYVNGLKEANKITETANHK